MRRIVGSLGRMPSCWNRSSMCAVFTERPTMKVTGVRLVKQRAKPLNRRVGDEALRVFAQDVVHLV